jgi:hypothetical protein
MRRASNRQAAARGVERPFENGARPAKSRQLESQRLLRATVLVARESSLRSKAARDSYLLSRAAVSAAAEVAVAAEERLERYMSALYAARFGQKE